VLVFNSVEKLKTCNAELFVTLMTMFLGELTFGNSQATYLFLPRFLDIIIGSVIGLIGEWLLYHEGIFKNSSPYRSHK